MTEPKREPIDIDRGDVVQVPQFPYLLHHHEFLKLTRIHSFVAIWAHSFFAGTGVFLVTVLARFIDHRHFGASEGVSNLEWITLAILIVLVLVFEGINLMVPSDRRTVTKKIQQHFKDHEE